MPSNYPFRPRGIVKWHAFSALLSGEEQKESAYTQEELDIDLFEDKLNQLNQTLLQALDQEALLNIEYVENNEIKKIDSIIQKIDYHTNEIIFEDLTLDVLQIINLTII